MSIVRKVVRQERGLTLIEMLVVMVITAVLASIVMPKVASAVTKARVNSDISQGKDLQDAIARFENTNGRNPNTVAELYSGNFITQVTSSQKYGGANLAVRDGVSGVTGDPVFLVDLANGSVIVQDVSSSPPVQVWP